MRATSKDNVGIHFEVEGEGAPLVLLHGFADCLQSWRETGYTRTLAAAGRKLIMIDQRGHGESNRPHDNVAYAGERRAGDVVAVLDALRIERADLYGYSMGSWCALNVARFHPARVGRLIVGASHPFAQSLSFYRGALMSKSVWTGIMRALGGSLSPEWQERIARNDVEALRAAVADDRASFSASLRGFGNECLFYVGTKDSRRAMVARAAALLPTACFVELKDCDHIGAFLRTDLVLPHVIRFLNGDILSRGLSSDYPIADRKF